MNGLPIAELHFHDGQYVVLPKDDEGALDDQRLLLLGALIAAAERLGHPDIAPLVGEEIIEELELLVDGFGVEECDLARDRWRDHVGLIDEETVCVCDEPGPGSQLSCTSCSRLIVSEALTSGAVS